MVILREIELFPENDSREVKDVKKLDLKFSSKLHNHPMVEKENVRTPDKFNIFKNISNYFPNAIKLDYKETCRYESLFFLSRNITLLLFGEYILKKFDENHEAFGDFHKLDSSELEDIFELYGDISKVGISDFHDSDLMDRFMFGKILDDLLILTQCISQVRSNDKVSTTFDTYNTKSIPIKDYLVRLVKFCLCSPSLFIIMFIYIIRILKNNPSCVFDFKSAHKLMLSTLIICVKLYDDKLLTHSDFAQVGGVSNKELRRIEMEALKHMNFELKVDSEEFVQFILSVRMISHYLKGLKSLNVHV